MRVFSRSGPLVLVLGAALVGCSEQPVNAPTKASNPSAKAGPAATAPAKNAAAYDYVLAIDGMT